MAAGLRLPLRRWHAVGAGDPARVGVLGLLQHQDHAGPGPGGERHRRGPGRADRARGRGGRGFHLDGAKRVPGPAPDHKSYGSYASFNDPDGNDWLLQEVTTRLPGRTISVLAAYGSVAALADALRRAEAAHGRHEKEIGTLTRTGRTGTRSTWRTSRPGGTRAHKRRVKVNLLRVLARRAEVQRQGTTSCLEFPDDCSGVHHCRSRCRETV